MIADFKLYSRRSIPTRQSEPEIVEVKLSVSDRDTLKAIDTMILLLGTVRDKYVNDKPAKSIIDDDEEDEPEEPLPRRR